MPNEGVLGAFYMDRNEEIRILCGYIYKLLGRREHHVMASSNYTTDQIISAFQAGIAAGTAAGNAQIRKLASQTNPQGKMLDVCGGSILHLDVDGRMRLGRLLAGIHAPNISVQKYYEGGFIVDLHYGLEIIPPVNGQEQSIYYEADKAAANVIQKKLRIRADAMAYID